MLRRIPALAFTAVLALAVLVVGHNLVFLLTYGPQYSVALVRSGHDGRWNDTVRDVLAASGMLAAAATLRLAYLYRLVRLISPVSGSGRPSLGAYVRVLLPFWGRLFAVSLLLFVLQENLERHDQVQVNSAMTHRYRAGVPRCRRVSPAWPSRHAIRNDGACRRRNHGRH